ncbi:kinase-like protein, partial [Rhizopus microsporus var. microsporus]
MAILEDLSDEYIHKPCTILVYNNKALAIANHSERNSLCNFLKSEKPNFLERLKLAEAIICGLIYLHCHNLVHCNLTSSCVILDENNTPKFRSAGLVRVGVDNTANNSVSENAVRWMAPELLTGSPPSFKSDIFSLGVILWEILANGSYPYKELVDNASISEMVLMGYRNLFPKDVLPSYRKLVENCWQNDPDDRPKSIELLSIMHF